jgi:putative alpha-1,2-mannosidase
MYKTGPDGLSGNDDCGQMSAWFVWSALGMYPMNPAGGEYVFGYPLLDRAEIALPDGKRLRIAVSRRKGGTTTGIVSARWNGKEIPVRSIEHRQLMQGGLLEFAVND